MARFFKLYLRGLIALIVCGTCPATEAQENAQAANLKPATQAKAATADSDAEKKLIEKLERYLTGTRWTGQFTVTGKELNDLTPEYYEITKAVKTPHEDYWLLSVRIKYGNHDSTLDLPPIQIKWAGETPVITVDQATIIGFGTFDARVVIRKNKYAGTWTHDAVGGHLFGSIERIKPKSETKKEDKSGSPDK